MQELLKLEQSLHGVIDPIIMELIKIRASQINGCAYCLNMHVVDALKLGETMTRIVLLDAWWETNEFSAKEKVVLELVERVTLISSHHMDEAFYDKLAEFFSDEEFTYLVLLISQINTWNRINIATSADIDKNYK